MLLAIVLYFAGFEPGASSQKGALLPPGLHVTNWQMKVEQGEPLQSTGRWQLLLTAPGPCIDRCEYWREQLAQVYRALGKEKERVQWRLLEAGASIDSSSKKELRRLGAGVWIADPHGNLVLRYQLTQPAEDLLKDLRRLLKVSRIG